MSDTEQVAPEKPVSEWRDIKSMSRLKPDERGPHRVLGYQWPEGFLLPECICGSHHSLHIKVADQHWFRKIEKRAFYESAPPCDDCIKAWRKAKRRGDVDAEVA